MDLDRETTAIEIFSPGAIGRRIATLLLIASAVTLSACKDEQHVLRAGPMEDSMYKNAVPVSDLHPGGKLPQAPVSNPYANNAAAIEEGQKLFDRYNCSGCHAQGGGGIGPPFIDHDFIYGNSPDNIFESILEGRPNGMPAWGHRIPEDQVWKLVTYVQSLNGATPKWITPPRTDSLSLQSPQ